MPMPLMLDDAVVAAALDYRALAEAMVGAFVNPPRAPRRTTVEVIEANGNTRTILTMPAVRQGGIMTTKVVTVLTGIDAGVRSHLIVVAADGTLLAVLDGHELTARRTAAASILAARTLGVSSPRVLAVLGAGRQARAQAEAYCACFRIEHVRIWARRTDAAQGLATTIASNGVRATVAMTLREAIHGADVVTAATMSLEPLVRSADVATGCHIDLVGGFRPDMREADDALMARGLVVADGAAAIEEAGDLAGPIATGALKAVDVVLLEDILAKPHDRGRHEITVFKSVGHAAEDLIAIELLFARLGVTADRR